MVVGVFDNNIDLQVQSFYLIHTSPRVAILLVIGKADDIGECLAEQQIGNLRGFTDVNGGSGVRG